MRMLIAPPCSGKATAARALTEIVDGDNIPELSRVYAVLRGKHGDVWYFNETAIAEKNAMMKCVRHTIDARVERNQLLATAETALPGPNDIVIAVIPTVDTLMLRNKSRRPEQFKYKSREEAEKIHRHYGDWAVRTGVKVMQDVLTAAVTLLNEPATQPKFQVLK